MRAPVFENEFPICEKRKMINKTVANHLLKYIKII